MPTESQGFPGRNLDHQGGGLTANERFNLLPALVAGFIATMVMTAMMTMASKAGMTRMPPMPPVMGSMMSGDRRKAMAIGSMLHFVVMDHHLRDRLRAGVPGSRLDRLVAGRS